MKTIQIPEQPDSALINFEDFCALIHTPQRTVRDWRQRGVGPRWTRPAGTGRLYTSLGEVRSFLGLPTGATTQPVVST